MQTRDFTISNKTSAKHTLSNSKFCIPFLVLLLTNMLKVPRRRDSRLMTISKQLLVMIGLILFVITVCVVVSWDESDSAVMRNLLVEGRIGGGCWIESCDTKKGLTCNKDVDQCEIEKVEHHGDCLAPVQTVIAQFKQNEEELHKGMSQICAEKTDFCGWWIRPRIVRLDEYDSYYQALPKSWRCCKTKDHGSKCID